LRLAVIPARGGSKRIPRKNIRPFLGVPMLARTINLLQASGAFDRIVVSTDDEEIVEVAVAAGATAPFRRPAALADDHTPTLPVIRHAVREIEAGNVSPSFVCCVYPAAVLVDPPSLSESLEMLRTSDADYVFTATSFPFPIQRALRRLDNGSCEMFWPEHRSTRSQDLEAAYHDAGQFYWGTRSAWIEERPIFTHRSRMLVLPRNRVQDIDTLEDWDRAEQIFRLLHPGDFP